MLDEHDIIDDRPGRYYVSVRDGARHAFLLGPYDSHLEALENVDRGRRLANEADPRAAWYAFGTARIDDTGATKPGLFGR